MSIIKKTLLGGALAAALGASAVAIADSGFGGRHGGGLGGLTSGDPVKVARAAERLDLNEAQRNEIDAIMDASRIEMRPLANALVAARREMREVMRADSFDEAAVRAAAQKASAAQVEVTVARARLRAQVQAVLTEEQREKLARMGHRGGGKHGWRQHGERHGRHGMSEGREHGRGHGMGHGMGQGMAAGMHRGMGPGAAETQDKPQSQ